MLVIFRGPPASGKSTFAHENFDQKQIVSSDKIREILFDDVNFDLEGDKVFEFRDSIIRERLRNGLLTVADSMHLRISDIRSIVQIAEETFSDFIIISFNCNNNIYEIKRRLRERNGYKLHKVSEDVFDKKLERYNNSTEAFKREYGYRFVEFDAITECTDIGNLLRGLIRNKYVKYVNIEEEDVWCIGDVHACNEEFEEILNKCTKISLNNGKAPLFYQMGDIIDRGPDPIETYKICRKYGVKLIQGNHEYRYIREFIYKNAHPKSKARVLTHEVFSQHELHDEFVNYIGKANHFYELILRKKSDSRFLSRCILSHAGIEWNKIHGFNSSVYAYNRSFRCIPSRFGYAGTIEDLGQSHLPNLRQVMGHRHYQYKEIKDDISTLCNINIDSGVVYGEKLTALNICNNEIVTVNSKKQYYNPKESNTVEDKFIKFPSIGQFKETIRHVTANARYIGKDADGKPEFDLTKTLPNIPYVGHVKIHGTNASVVLTENDFYAQSRNRILTPGDDNFGFAAFIHNIFNKSIEAVDKIRQRYFVTSTELTYAKRAKHVVIYGEWCGPGIQKVVGISKIKQPVFVVFGIRVTDAEDRVRWIDNEWVRGINDRIFIIEDFGEYKVDIDFNNPGLIQNTLIQYTEAVEAECPVAKYFGEIGIGEGVVWKPECMDLQDDSSYWFKVKGEKHSGSGEVRVLLPVDTEKAASLAEFIKETVTPARLEQAYAYLKEMNKPLDRKSTGDFIKWVITDIIKEHYDVMEASYIQPKAISLPVSNIARAWYFEKIDEVTQ